MLNYIITHPGSAHRDELLAIALLLARHKAVAPIYRRTPTPEELADPRVAVVDCGGRHEAELLNFDHHQGLGDSCACALVMAWMGHDRSAREECPWYETTNDLDLLGPDRTATRLGITRDQMQRLQSPLEGALLRQFTAMSTVAEWLTGFLLTVGTHLLKQAEGRQRQSAEVADRITVLEVSGVPGLYSPVAANSNGGLTAYRLRHCPTAAFSICPDKRGPGQTLYRFNDDPRLDFCRLADDARLAFVHPGGFIAKTRGPEPLAVLRDLIAQALAPSC